MSIYVHVMQALAGLAGGRVFPLVADEGVDTPYIVVQRVGGPATNFLTGEAPEKQMNRVQVTVWAASVLEAEAVGGQVEAAIRGAVDLQPEVLGRAVDDYDPTTKYKGSRQEFRIFC
ncbi:DUF3168 domain-containing protein [Massilia sp. BKSP1R2A-1]|uniref:DUF3168 domain-containing protein n=1 Tax=Massilia sp. BKSP1R2A-1 TaxID=3422595 RepID=UPI003D33082D